MATVKTQLLIEVNSKEFNASYTGGLKPEWDHLSPAERKRVHKHDDRMIRALLAIYEQDREVYERIAGFFRAVDRFKRREAKKRSKQESNRT